MHRSQEIMVAQGRKYQRSHKLITSKLSSYPTGQPIHEIYWRSMIQDDGHIQSDAGGVALDYQMNLVRKFEAGEIWTDKARQAVRIQRWKRVAMSGVNILAFTISFSVIAHYYFSTRSHWVTFWRWLCHLIALLPIATFASTRIMAMYAEHMRPLVAWQMELVLESRKHQNLTVENRRNAQRLMAITGRGYVAWVNKEVKEGDVIAQIEDYPIPFILRKAKAQPGDGRVNYELIGDCYLHGMMGPGKLQAMAGLAESIRLV
jgi:hypothetical protein